jgi:hypothetical protein
MAARSALRLAHGERGTSVARVRLPTSKPFLQAFPNFGLFSPSFSKVSFGGFVGFQWVTVAAKPIKSPFQIFGLLPWLEEPVARRQTRLDR